MHCHGHNRVPGVTPERDQRPKARQPTSVAQRRGAAHYRTITTAVSWRLAGERADGRPSPRRRQGQKQQGDPDAIDGDAAVAKLRNVDERVRIPVRDRPPNPRERKPSDGEDQRQPRDASADKSAAPRNGPSPNTYTLTAWRSTVPIRLPHGDR